MPRVKRLKSTEFYRTNLKSYRFSGQCTREERLFNQLPPSSTLMDQQHPFVDASTNTDTDVTLFEETDEQPEAPPLDEEADQPVPERQEEDPAIEERRRQRRQQFWFGNMPWPRPPPNFVPDRSSVHFATTIIRLSEALDPHAVGEVTYYLRNIRCPDGSPFFAGPWSADRSEGFYKIFNDLEKMKLINTRDAYYLLNILEELDKPTHYHFVHRFHSMLKLLEPTQGLPEILVKDRFLFAVSVAMENLPACSYEEVLRVKMCISKVFGLENYITQYVGWKLGGHRESILYFQAPFSYLEHILFSLCCKVTSFLPDLLHIFTFYINLDICKSIMPENLLFLLRDLKSLCMPYTVNAKDIPSIYLRFSDEDKFYFITKPVEQSGEETVKNILAYLTVKEEPQHPILNTVMLVKRAMKEQIGAVEMNPLLFTCGKLEDLRTQSISHEKELESDLIFTIVYLSDDDCLMTVNNVDPIPKVHTDTQEYGITDVTDVPAKVLK